jgi:putative FmdB family regulatory protein
VPKYCYKCSECENEIEVRHGMSERLEDCEVCDNQGVLIRIPQLTNIVRKQEQGNKSTGSLTREYIEENKKILKQEKKNRIEYNE